MKPDPVQKVPAWHWLQIEAPAGQVISMRWLVEKNAEGKKSDRQDSQEPASGFKSRISLQEGKS